MPPPSPDILGPAAAIARSLKTENPPYQDLSSSSNNELPYFSTSWVEDSQKPKVDKEMLVHRSIGRFYFIPNPGLKVNGWTPINLPASQSSSAPNTKKRGRSFEEVENECNDGHEELTEDEEDEEGSTDGGHGYTEGKDEERYADEDDGGNQCGNVDEFRKSKHYNAEDRDEKKGVQPESSIRPPLNRARVDSCQPSHSIIFNVAEQDRPLITLSERHFLTTDLRQKHERPLLFQPSQDDGDGNDYFGPHSLHKGTRDEYAVIGPSSADNLRPFSRLQDASKGGNHDWT